MIPGSTPVFASIAAYYAVPKSLVAVTRAAAVMTLAASASSLAVFASVANPVLVITNASYVTLSASARVLIANWAATSASSTIFKSVFVYHNDVAVLITMAYASKKP